MGLDMHLYKEKYTSNFQGNKLKVKGFEDCSSVTVKGKIAYWRKANAIHRWFVLNCGRGIDECQEIYVSRDDLKRLLKNVTKVLEDNDSAESILPTSEGFFFGNTEYGSNYFDDLRETKRTLEKILNADDFEDYTYIYQASW